jgi:hypothetical protein
MITDRLKYILFYFKMLDPKPFIADQIIAQMRQDFL